MNEVKMDYKSFTALLFKVAGTIIVIYSLSEVPKYFGHAMEIRRDTPVSFVIFVAAMPVIIPFIIGLLMMIFPSAITNRIIVGDNLLQDADPMLARIERIVLSILGVYLLVTAVSDLLYHISRAIIFMGGISSEGYALSPLAAEAASNIISSFFELGFGFWLVLGSQGMLNAIRKYRH